MCWVLGPQEAQGHLDLDLPSASIQGDAAPLCLHSVLCMFKSCAMVREPHHALSSPFDTVA